MKLLSSILNHNCRTLTLPCNRNLDSPVVTIAGKAYDFDKYHTASTAVSNLIKLTSAEKAKQEARMNTDSLFLLYYSIDERKDAALEVQDLGDLCLDKSDPAYLSRLHELVRKTDDLIKRHKLVTVELAKIEIKTQSEYVGMSHLSHHLMPASNDVCHQILEMAVVVSTEILGGSLPLF